MLEISIYRDSKKVFDSLEITEDAKDKAVKIAYSGVVLTSVLCARNVFITVAENREVFEKITNVMFKLIGM